MKFGSREICDVVLKAKSTMKVGNKVFYKNEPVLYFDTLKTSTIEQAVSPVYAQGGKGNARLVAWEGDKTVTFTMEDALISPEGLMILAGAELLNEASASKPILQHVSEIIGKDDFEVQSNGDVFVWVSQQPYLPENEKENFAYVMTMKNGEIDSEPFIPEQTGKGYFGVVADSKHLSDKNEAMYKIIIKAHKAYDSSKNEDYATSNITKFQEVGVDSVLVDYYTPKKSGAKQINISPESFGGNFYLEASTLFRDTNGVDMPAEFVIPNCRIQSNFSMAMAPTGDPSTFTFTMDAFPDYTRFDKTKKVMVAIQIIEEPEENFGKIRLDTNHTEANEVKTQTYVVDLTPNEKEGTYTSSGAIELKIAGKAVASKEGPNKAVTAVDLAKGLTQKEGYTVSALTNTPYVMVTAASTENAISADGDVPFELATLNPESSKPADLYVQQIN